MNNAAEKFLIEAIQKVADLEEALATSEYKRARAEKVAMEMAGDTVKQALESDERVALKRLNDSLAIEWERCVKAEAEVERLRKCLLELETAAAKKHPGEACPCCLP